VLPHGIGKSKRVVVFAKGALADDARAAGAEEVGADDLAKKIKEGWTDFDVCIAAPDMMGLVGPLGKVLGPRGLMPNPRSGTIVTPDALARTIVEVRGGRVEFRNDRTGLLHVGVAKVSFSEAQIYENITALMDAVKAVRPAAAKGSYVRSVTFTSTMAPAVRVDPATAQTMGGAA